MIEVSITHSSNQLEKKKGQYWICNYREIIENNQWGQCWHMQAYRWKGRKYTPQHFHSNLEVSSIRFPASKCSELDLQILGCLFELIGMEFWNCLNCLIWSLVLIESEKKWRLNWKIWVLIHGWFQHLIFSMLFVLLQRDTMHQHHHLLHPSFIIHHSFISIPTCCWARGGVGAVFYALFCCCFHSVRPIFQTLVDMVSSIMQSIIQFFFQFIHAIDPCMFVAIVWWEDESDDLLIELVFCAPSISGCKPNKT